MENTLENESVKKRFDLIQDELNDNFPSKKKIKEDKVENLSNSDTLQKWQDNWKADILSCNLQGTDLATKYAGAIIIYCVPNSEKTYTCQIVGHDNKYLVLKFLETSEGAGLAYWNVNSPKITYTFEKIGTWAPFLSDLRSSYLIKAPPINFQVVSTTSITSSSILEAVNIVLEESVSEIFKLSNILSPALNTPLDNIGLSIPNARPFITLKLITKKFNEWQIKLVLNNHELYNFLTKLSHLTNYSEIGIVGGAIRDITLGQEYKDIDVVSPLYTSQIEDFLIKNNVEIVDRTINGGFIVYVGNTNIDIWSWPDSVKQLFEIDQFDSVAFPITRYPETMVYNMDATMVMWSGTGYGEGFPLDYNSGYLSFKCKGAAGYKRLLAKKALRLKKKYGLELSVPVKEFIKYHVNHGMKLNEEGSSDGKDNYI